MPLFSRKYERCFLRLFLFFRLFKIQVTSLSSYSKRSTSHLKWCPDPSALDNQSRNTSPAFLPAYLPVSWVLKPRVAKLRTAFPFHKMNSSQQLLFCLVFNPMELSPGRLYRSCLGRGSQTAVNTGSKSAPSEEKWGKTLKCESPTGHGMHTRHS